MSETSLLMRFQVYRIDSFQQKMSQPHSKLMLNLYLLHQQNTYVAVFGLIIYHTDQDVIDKTSQMIKDIVREVEDNKIYTGKVVKVEDFGCFVELWPGCEGMCHVSQLAWERVDKPQSMFKVGDEIIVKAEGYDNKNRLNLSRKAALPKPERKEDKI